VKGFRALNAVEQLAVHLRTEILQGRLSGEMPGVRLLAAKLGASPNTMVEAVRLLEAEGLVADMGPGRRKRIELPRGTIAPGLRIGLFLFEPADRFAYDTLELRHQLAEAGHSVIIPARTLSDIGMDLRRVARVVKGSEADAWVVWSASGEVLRWFAGRDFPFLAYAGQYPPETPMAAVAPGFEAATVAAVRRLVSLGHRRIVLLTRAGAKPAYFLRELEAQGIPTGSYNLPDCGPGAEEFRRCLESLLAVTPPTAMILDEQATFLAVQLQLARRGLFAPRDVSLICVDTDSGGGLWDPVPARISWDTDAIVRRIAQWADNVARGRRDERRVFIQAELTEGGTIGPAPG
jgi:DNA-binding LacI/PurR family transcriptional regulator